MSEATTIRVSKSTLQNLEGIRDREGARSIDQTIQLLIMNRRGSLLSDALGIDRGRISSFTEEDRGEDRS